MNKVRKLSTTAVAALVISVFNYQSAGTTKKESTGVVTRVVCGESAGYDYSFPGGLRTMLGRPSGWEKSGIPKGRILLVYDDGEPDIIVVDATGSKKVASKQGAIVTEVSGSDPGFRIILVIYPGHGTVEHYLFMWDSTGSGTVVWGTVRSTGIFRKSSLFVAKCQAF